MKIAQQQSALESALVRQQGRVSQPRRGSVARAMTPRAAVHRAIAYHSLDFSARIRPLAGLVTVLFASVLTTLLVVGRGEAAPIITGLTPTGVNATAGNVLANTRDANWMVERVATSGSYQSGYPMDDLGDPISPPIGGGVNPVSGTPYASYVFQSGSMPAGYLGGAQNFGYCGGLWIGLQNSALSIVDGNDPPPFGEYHSSAVFSLKFQASEAGIASFDFWGASDNAVAFFVGGTITTSTSVVTGTVQSPGGPIAFPNAANTGADFPTIFGGTQIGFAQGFSVLQHFVGNAPVVQGDNTLYAVVYDYGRSTGFMFSPVPEPSSMIMAAIAGGCILVGSRRRWQRRKVTPHLADPSCTASS
jgi:hypothetical protein